MNYSPQRLRDYALWYYFRYYPSDGRLLQKLREKGTEDYALQVFSDIKHLLQEDEILASKIDNYIYRNKNYRYIEQKMHQKLFPKDKIQDYLKKYKQSWKSLLDENFLRRKIQNYLAKGKSRRYIFMTLGETSEDKEKLNLLLDEYLTDGESENIEKELEKTKHKFTSNPSLIKRGEFTQKWKQQIIQKLLAKWFCYDEVKKVL